MMSYLIHSVSIFSIIAIFIVVGIYISALNLDPDLAIRYSTAFATILGVIGAIYASVKAHSATGTLIAAIIMAPYAAYWFYPIEIYAVSIIDDVVHLLMVGIVIYYAERKNNVM